MSVRMYVRKFWEIIYDELLAKIVLIRDDSNGPEALNNTDPEVPYTDPEVPSTVPKVSGMDWTQRYLGWYPGLYIDLGAL